MSYELIIEENIGFFDTAISHASDTNMVADTIHSFSKYYGINLYSYQSKKLEQIGIDVFEVMKFIYSNAKKVIILNSLLYRSTWATKFEYEIIAKSDNVTDIFVFNLGGKVLFFPKRPNVFQFNSITNQNVISVMNTLKN